MLLIKRNSFGGSSSNSAANTIKHMGTQRRPLTHDEQGDAKRLNAIWLRQKRALRLTQEQVAADCGWYTQAAFSQYLLGRIPLNLPAALRIAKALKVSVSEFSPRLASLLQDARFSAEEDAPRYIAPPKEKQEQETKRATWLRLYDELQREGMSDAGLRLISNLASELRRKKRATASKKHARKKM